MTSEQWLSELYQKNYALLYRIGRVVLGTDPVWENLIEDQIQETFVRAWQKYSYLREHPNPDGWLVECFRKCLANACRKQNREWKRRRIAVSRELPDPAFSAETPDPEMYMKAREQTDLLIRLLGEEDARLFIRYCINGEKAGEMAEELKISEQAFRMHIYRLKKKILKNREMFTCLVLLCLYGLK